MISPITDVVAGAIKGVLGGANDIAKTVWGSKEQQDVALAEEQKAVLDAYKAEFVSVVNRTWFDSLIDGLNRLIRPFVTLSAMGLVVHAYYDPVAASLGFQALEIVPAWLYTLIGGILAFWFGGRILQQGVPVPGKVDPEKTAMAKSIAEQRLALKRQREEEARLEAEALKEEEKAIEEIDLVHAEEVKTVGTNEVAVIPTVYVQNRYDFDGTLDVSPSGRELIKRFEGFRSKPYKCPAGVWTIGYGHTQGVTSTSQAITEDAADNLLRKDLDVFERGVLASVTRHPTQNQFDAMVSLAFNIGLANFRKSSVLRKFNNGDIRGAGDAFLLWNKARVNGVLVPLRGLTLRREAERELFLGH